MDPNFKNPRKFSENLVGVEMDRPKIMMIKPVYLGQAILDLSSLVIYELYYYYIVPKYGEKLQQFFIDTENFVYHIKTGGFYEHIARDLETWFHTGRYTTENARSHSFEKNKGIVGLIKDELGRKAMAEFVALRAKFYAYKQLGEKQPEDKQYKGINKCAVKKKVTFYYYKKCLWSGCKW